MKHIKYLFLMLSVLMAMTARAQYNPENPPEPGRTYRLAVKPEPANGGSVSASVNAPQAGQRVSVSAYPSTGFVFVRWEDAAGTVLSTSNSMQYTMPASDVTLTARFRYSPSDPSEPSATEYARVNVTANPSNGGSTSGSGRYAVGSTVSLYAYTNTGFKFVNWTLDGEVIGTSSRLQYVVRKGSNDIRANYEYSPDSPGEPQPTTPRRKLFLKVSPEGAGSLNLASGNSYPEGSRQQLTAWANTGFKFRAWTDAAGDTVSTSATFNYTIPAANSTLTARYEYSPDGPEEPGAPSPRRNVIYGSRQSVQAGSNVFYDVSLDNTDQITGISVDVTLPEGYGSMLDYLHGSGAGIPVLTARASSHTLSVQPVEQGTYRIFVRGSEPISGGSGAVVRIPFTVPASAEAGMSVHVGMSKGVVFKADGSQTPVDAMDGIIKIAENEISLPDSPDFRITEVNAEACSIMPGDNLSVSWTVTNSGTADATAGWSEVISLVNENGKRATLATLYYDTSRLGIGETVSRNATVTIPALPGIDGKMNVMISIVPYAASGEIDEFQLNNTASGSGFPVTLGKRLVLDVPALAVEGTDTSVRCMIMRSGDWSESETFALAKLTGDSRLRLPESVLIPKDQSGAYFMVAITDNDELDESAAFTIQASGNGYEPVTADLTVEDDEMPEIALSLSNDSIVEGSTVRLTVTLPRISSTDVTVSLGSDAPGRFSMPATVVVAAGSLSATVDVVAVDNDRIESVADVAFRATAPHYGSGEAYVMLYDNDMPMLAMELMPVEVSEGAGPRAIRGTLRRLTNTGNRVTVLFSDDTPGALQYNGQMVLDAGVDEIDFNIGVTDNARVDGDRRVTLTAAVFLQSCSCSANTESGGSVSGTVTIIDNDGPSLSMRASSATLRRDSRTTTLTIERNTPDSTPVNVALGCDADGVLNMPPTVLIPVGEQSVTVEVEALESAFTGVEIPLTINAKADGYAKGTMLMLLSDRTLPDATVTLRGINTDSELIPGETVKMTARVSNEGNTVMPDAVPVDIHLSGTADPVVTVYTTRKLNPGEYENVAIETAAPSIPGSYKFTAHVNEANNFGELTRTNNTSEAVDLTVKSPFTASVGVGNTVILPGDSIIVSGRTPGYSGALEVYYITDKARFAAPVTPDATGNFSVDIAPAFPGDYTLGVCIPGEEKTDEMASFIVRGMQADNSGYLTFDLPVEETMTRTLRLTNSSSEALTGLKITADRLPAGADISFGDVTAIGGHASVNVGITVTGKAVTEGSDWEKVKLTVTSDQGAVTTKTIYVYCRANQANLVASVSSINTTMTMGQQGMYSFVIANNGKAPSGDITLSLPAFMRSGTAMTLPSLESGESADVNIMLTPSAEMQLNVPVTGKIGINCSGNGLAIPYSIEPVSDLTGRLIVDAKDEYTFYTEEAPHVADADVMVSHPVTGRMIAHGKTGTDGTWSTELPAGFYTLEVSANRHDSWRGTIQVAPGRDNMNPVFLAFNAITYSWHVEETTVDDSYNIVTTVDFETRVPKPVVVVDFPRLPYRNQIVYFSVTNKGLLSAHNVQVRVPEPNENITFEVIGDNVISELRAGENRMIPVRVSVDEEDKFPEATLTVSSYSFTGQVAGDDARVMRAPGGDSGGCTTSPCSVDVDDYECDPLTGEPKYKGKKSTEGTYRHGNCGGPGSWPPGASVSGIPGFGGGGGWGGGPGSPGGGGSGGGETSTYWQDRMRTFLMTGCMSDCEKALAKALASCADAAAECTGMKPDLGPVVSAIQCAQGVAESCHPDSITSINASLGCGNSAAGCHPDLGCPSGIFGCLQNAYDAFKKCMELYHHRQNQQRAPVLRADGNDDSDSDAMLDAKSKRVETIILFAEYNDIVKRNTLNLLGDGAWNRLTGKDLSRMLTYVNGHRDENGYIVIDNSTLEGKPECVDVATYQHFLERINNSVRFEATGESADNMLDRSVMEANRKRALEIKARALEMGYPDFAAFTAAAAEEAANIAKLNEEPADGVCASVTIKFNQTMVLTRQAFRGTLSITNGNDEVSMADIKLQVKIRDEEGNLVGEREFAVMAESLDGFEGEKDLTAGWTLGAKTTGEATVLFIPSRYAAPVKSRVYSFGGVLSYTDPFTGVEVSRELSPIDMTVSPSPVLDLDYFMQRDVLGDDALTEDRIESSVPAEFALLISNKGFGDATNLRMTTDQPQIVDNTKGLAIDFEIIGSSLNGSEMTMALGKQIPTDFGNLKAQSTTYAQWWFKSSLLGHFTSYDVKATQMSAYGSEDMSLLDRVSIHELIHGMTPENGSDGSRAFLVNDIADADNCPDMLYFTDDASVAQVVGVSSAQLTDVTDESCLLTVNAAEPGWQYGRIDVPWTGSRRVVRAVRMSDGKEVPADNFWSTSVTLRNSAAPVYEEKLHFAALLSGLTESYRLTLEPRPEPELDIVEIGGVPAESEIGYSPVTSVTVKFNKPIDETTFEATDIAIKCQGIKVDTSRLTITRHADWSSDMPLYVMDLTPVTKQSGYYTLVIDLIGVDDAEGFCGSHAKSASWIQLADGKVQVTAVASPADGGTVSPADGRYAYGTDLRMTAEAAEGYEFSVWMMGNDIVSDKPSFDFRPMEDVTLQANFLLRRYHVEIECDETQGTVSGAGTGIYTYGAAITLVAQPADGYKFIHWENGERQIVGTDLTLEWTVKSDVMLHPVFECIATGITAVTGDNGVNAIYPVPTGSRLFIDGDFERIVNVMFVDSKGSRTKICQGYTKGVPVNVSDLLPGVYVVRIQTERGISSHRMVKL